MADALWAIELTNVLNNLKTTLIVKVHINIRHLRALWREEPLKHEAVFKRIKGGDIHRISNDGSRCRSAARSNANTVLFGPAHILLNNEEIIRKTFLTDNVVLILKALFDIDAANLHFTPVFSIAPGKSFFTFLTEALLRRFPFSKVRKLWQIHMRPVQLIVALIGNLKRVINHLGSPRENLAHFFFCFEIKLIARHALSIGISKL